MNVLSPQKDRGKDELSHRGLLRSFLVNLNGVGESSET